MTLTRLSLHVCLALTATGAAGAALAQDLTVEAADAPPTAPSQLTANPYSGTAAGIIWERSTDDVRVAGYEVTLDGEVVQESDARTYVDFDLAPATTYRIGVTAVDSAGQRSETAFVEFDTLGGAAAPAGGDIDASGPAPVEGLRANVYSPTALGLIWARPAGVGLDYELSRDGEVLGTTDGVTYVDVGLAPGTYVYDVVAIDADGNRSAPTSVEVSTVPGTAGAPGSDADDAGTATPTGNSILDFARGTDGDGDGTFTGGVEGFDTLLRAAGDYPELVDLLDDEGAVLTVFAPTDEAFAAVDLSAASADDIENVLRYHVVSGTAFDTMALAADTTFPMTLETVQGGTLEIVEDGDGSLSVVDSAGNAVALDAVANSASNGVVYGIDAVLVAPPADASTDVGEPMDPMDPAEPAAPGEPAEPAEPGDGDASAQTEGTLFAYLVRNDGDGAGQGSSTLARALLDFPDLVEALDDETAELTVLAPSDAAFAAVDLGGSSTERVRDVLAYHVITGTVFDASMPTDGTVFPLTLETAQGGTLQIVDGGDRGFAVLDATGVQVALGTVAATGSNGVAYVIDTVLTPPADGAPAMTPVP